MDGWIDEQSKDYVSLLNEMIGNSFIVIPLFALVLACAFTGIVPGLLLPLWWNIYAVGRLVLFKLT